MYYDDEARRFNFISGLVLGVVLGSGLALLARPVAPRQPIKRLRRSVERVGKTVSPRLERLREDVVRKQAEMSTPRKRARKVAS